MKNNGIIISSDPRGRFIEGRVKTGQTIFPGMILQIDPTVPMENGRPTFQLYDRSKNGEQPAGPLIVAVENNIGGKTTSDSYTAGQWIQGYIPIAGDELNLLLKDVAGTADTHPAGTTYVVEDGSGLLIKTTGTHETTPFMTLETLPALTGNTLAWVIYSGY